MRHPSSVDIAYSAMAAIAAAGSHGLTASEVGNALINDGAAGSDRMSIGLRVALDLVERGAVTMTARNRFVLSRRPDPVKARRDLRV
jgi:hypothetical protein